MTKNREIQVQTNTHIMLSVIIGVLMAVIGLIIMYFMRMFFGRVSLYTAFGMAAVLVLMVFGSALRKSVKTRTFRISDNCLYISDNQQEIILPYSYMKNYNVYSLIPKNLGYIIRIRGNKNYCYWVTRGNENKESFQKNRSKLTTMLISANRLQKVELIDRMIICISYIPIVMLSFSILAIIGIFVWILTL